MYKDFLFLNLTCFKPPICKVGISKAKRCKSRMQSQRRDRSWTEKLQINEILTPKQATSCSYKTICPFSEKSLIFLHSVYKINLQLYLSQSYSSYIEYLQH